MSNYVIIGESVFAETLARGLQTDFIRITPRKFPDREIKTRLNVSTLKNIGDRIALFVIRANRFEPDPNDCLLKIVLIADTLTRYGIERKDLLLPYMFYARQDGERLPGESNTLSIIASIYENLSFNNLITVNSHLYGKKHTLQEFFKSITVSDLSATRLFASYLSTKNLENPFIIGPGSGPEKMAKELSTHLDCEYECLQKSREPETGRVDMVPPESDLHDKDVIIYDDIASSGGTTEMAYRLSEASNPKSLTIALPHLWTSQGINRLSVLGNWELITTNSFRTERVKRPFTELALEPMLIECLKNISNK
jgi:ribose-phosphate pyrophosphokinase